MCAWGLPRTCTPSFQSYSPQLSIPTLEGVSPTQWVRMGRGWVALASAHSDLRAQG